MTDLHTGILGKAADTVSPRNILFIGGTGVISTSAAERAVADADDETAFARIQEVKAELADLEGTEADPDTFGGLSAAS
mgnify:CR=1 FL=1